MTRKMCARLDIPEELLPEYLTIAQAAAVVGCHVNTLWRYARERNLPFERAGRRTMLFHRSTVMDLIREFDGEGGGNGRADHNS